VKVPSPPQSRILVVDDDPESRAVLSGVLERVGHVTRCVETGEEALATVADDTPSLVVLDVCLPGISGYEVCRELRERFGDDLPIVFVSAARTESYDRVAGLLVGGDDYLVKPVAPDELVIRVARLIRRSVPLNSTVTAKLTRREVEVLRLLAQGMSGKDVAERLVLSPKTVSTHVEHILDKLGVQNRAQAVALAFRLDLVGATTIDA
jgi:DNA-binding NarL/FixJ family response regulator